MSNAQQYLDKLQETYTHLDTVSYSDDYLHMNTTQFDEDNEIDPPERGFSAETTADEVFPLILFSLSGEISPEQGISLYLTEEYLDSIDSINTPLAWLLGMTQPGPEDNDTIYEDYRLMVDEEDLDKIPEADESEMRALGEFNIVSESGESVTIRTYNNNTFATVEVTYIGAISGLYQYEHLAIGHAEEITEEMMIGYINHILVTHIDLSGECIDRLSGLVGAFEGTDQS